MRLPTLAGRGLGEAARAARAHVAVMALVTSPVYGDGPE